MTGNVEIRMMGEFVILSDGREYNSLVGKTRKGVAFMEYLILNYGKQVPKQRLLSVLWSGYKHANPENSLKVMVSRLRKMLNDICEGLGECIRTDRGAYSWVNHLGMRVDALEIMEIFERLPEEFSETKKTALYNRLIEIYRGDLFLTGDFISGNEYSAAFHNEYLNAVYDYIELLMREGEFDKIIEVCTAAQKIDEFDERLHMEMMQAQVYTNRIGEAMEQYRKVTDIHEQYLDTDPSEEMKAFYAKIMRQNKALRFSLDGLKQELKEGLPPRGAYICGYEEFRQICYLMIPTLNRISCSLYMGLIMIGEQEDNPGVEEKVLDKLINNLISLLQDNLRQGDVISRISPTIVAVMLPSVNHTTGNMVLERIRQLFMAYNPKINIPFRYRLGEMVHALTENS